MQQQPRILGGDRHLNLHELIHALVEDGRLDKKNSDEFLIPARTGRLEIHPLVIISQQEWDDLARPGKKLTLEALTQWLAERAGLPYFRIDPLKVDVTAVTAVTSSAYAGKHRILPVKVDQHKVVIATAEPDIRSWEKELAHITGLQIERVIANPLDIARYLNEFYSVSHSIRRATSDKDDGQIPGITNLEQLVELGKTGSLDANDKDVVQIVDWLLQYAFDQRASDIHMEPRREKGYIRFRIDGVMHQVYDMPTPVMTALSSRIKVLGRMDVVEKRRPQDGRIKTLLPEGGEIELRLSTMPTAFGEKLVLRIFNPDVLVKDFTALGFSAKDITGWNQMVNQPNGIILVTGPTGSGKTTTLYSTLKQLAQPEVNVCTVEDPIEMVEPAFNQMQVQHNIGLDFASGVRTLLRQDPDIIMVGEIRDKETAEMAIQAALTGHLVLSTLHTNDASSAVTRLREIGVPAYLINATLLGVLAQRLVRTLCPHCKQPAEVDPDLWQALTRPWKLSGEPTFYAPVGCDECRNTGYMGRIGLYEMLRMTPAIRSQLGPDSDAAEIRRIAVNEGMVQLRISGAHKIAQGLTTMEEVLNVVPPDSEI
ncbi:GspE/PulE family protein [Thiohalophilus thiocyanatoxydans]|uniref:General secretion pathway protein E n=1 Tax=Thiohalophilus thiocyanatoxydans TaxID=381308 RepID=A0A4R8IPC8_9GAMM|nr:GspE/PulE family protein [Thiohalophilus thiocyanatoxydans]TDX99366.1 general secretion pathway protein E [Thiohalophilus thiocyanatoxydans]